MSVDRRGDSMALDPKLLYLTSAIGVHSRIRRNRNTDRIFAKIASKDRRRSSRASGRKCREGNGAINGDHQ